MLVLEFMFDYTAYSCIWSANQETANKFGGWGCISHETLGISEELDLRMTNLCKEYNTFLNWESPSSPSPRSEEEWISFKKRSRKAYDDLVKEIGDEYKIEYGLHE